MVIELLQSALLIAEQNTDPMLAIGPAAIIGGGLQLASGIFGASAAEKRKRELARQLKKAEQKLQILNSSRQRITNPYEDVMDMSSLARDLSSTITNPFANLSVATKAAEIQAEQSDIALANTLDTLRATGAGAGGATALAQAALQSKQNVAASIESQEAQNQKLKAQGEANAQMQRAAEQARVQAIRIGEAGRVQQLTGQGETIKMQMKEAREQDAIDYQRDKVAALTGASAQANVASTNALTGMLGSFGGGLMGLAGGSGGGGGGIFSKLSSLLPF